jgi:hypothetical protein
VRVVDREGLKTSFLLLTTAFFHSGIITCRLLALTIAICTICRGEFLIFIGIFKILMGLAKATFLSSRPGPLHYHFGPAMVFFMYIVAGGIWIAAGIYKMKGRERKEEERRLEEEHADDPYAKAKRRLSRSRWAKKQRKYELVQTKDPILAQSNDKDDTETTEDDSEDLIA